MYAHEVVSEKTRDKPQNKEAAVATVPPVKAQTGGDAYELLHEKMETEHEGGKMVTQDARLHAGRGAHCAGGNKPAGSAPLHGAPLGTPRRLAQPRNPKMMHKEEKRRRRGELQRRPERQRARGRHSVATENEGEGRGGRASENADGATHAHVHTHTQRYTYGRITAL